MWNAPPALSPSIGPVVVIPTPTVFATGQVSVTSDTVVLPANTKRVRVIFQNKEAAAGDDIYIHAPGGSATTGLKLFSGSDPVAVATQSAINASTGGGGAHVLTYWEELTS